MVSVLDDGVGRIVDALKRTGMLDNTMIFFISDNGAAKYGKTCEPSNLPLRGYKGDLYEGGIRVPFILHWPASPIQPGSVDDRAVTSLDVIPTVLAAAKADVPPQLDGTNLLPFLFDTPGRLPHEILFWRWMGKMAARQGPWKWVKVHDGNDELYHLSDDIQESENRAAQNPDVLAELKAHWKEWNRGLVAPLWRIGNQNEKFAKHYGGEGMAPAPNPNP